METGNWILKDRLPVRVELHDWAVWFENTKNRIVKQDEFGDVMVSTVFLGIDHNFGRRGGPLLFETMIFGGKEDGYQERYQTWQEAEAGHAEAIKLAKEKK